ncbi:MAG: discoidin domain-containing protein [Ruminococcaceae bacterium]|nr:discoidin domain-containing protein [Oscillospiraceae bacterium]
MRKIISFVLMAFLVLGICSVSSIQAQADEVALENLFLDATATVSTWYPDTNPPSYLNDGEASPDPSVAGTLLCTFGDKNLCHLEFNLPKAKEINQVKVCFNWQDVNYRAKDIAIDVQLENGTWVRVAEMHNPGMYPDVEDFDLLFTFETVKAKVVRVTGNGTRGDAPGWRVVEVEGYMNPDVTTADYTGTQKDANDAYNIPEVTSGGSSSGGNQGNPDPEVALDNLLIGATVTTPNWYPDTNPPSNLNDGEASPNPAEAGTVLCVFDDNKLCYFEFKLAKAKDINQVKVCFNWEDVTYRAKDIAIDVQLENGEWVRVAEMHDIKIYPDVEDFDLLFTFATVKAKVVRVTGNGARGDAPGWRVVEVEGYMNPDVTKADHTGTKKDSNDAYNIPEMTSGNSGNEGNQGNQGDPDVDPVQDNLFLGATVTTPNWYPDTNPPTNLNDGEFSPDPAVAGTTLCEFDGNKLCWFDFAFAEAVDINQVKIYLNWEDPDYRAKDIAIDVQMEDGTWVRVAEMHNVALYPDVEDFDLLFTFATVKAKVVRVTGSGVRNSAPGWRLGEVEGFLNPDVTEADYTGTEKDANDAYNIPELTADDPEPTDPEPTNPEETEPEETKPVPTEPEETDPEETKPVDKDEDQEENDTIAVILTMAVSLVVIAVVAVILVIYVRKKMK